MEQRRKEKEAKELKEKEQIDEEDWDLDVGKVKDVDDDDFMGSMDDF